MSIQFTGYPGIVSSIRKYGVAHKLVFKTKGPYRVLEKATPISYWLKRLTFCKGLGRPVIKGKKSAAMIEKISSTMVLHNHVYGSEIRLATMSVSLVNNPMGNGL